MSRAASLILVGSMAVLVLGVLSVVALLVGRSLFMINNVNTGTVTDIPVVMTSIEPTAIIPTTTMGQVTATAVPPTPFITPLPSATIAVVPTAITVLDTTVQYVLASTNVNIRNGPGTNYNIIGSVSEGQIARVTGLNSNKNWWRVVCPDGSQGSCWVTASEQYTQPTTPPTNAPATAVACVNAATFVADITIPDGSEIPTGAEFIKTWRIKNSGTCTWDGRYHFVHAGGPLLGAIVENMQLPATVAPGETIDLSVQMMAPVTPDNYQSDWKLQSPQGHFFGVGQNNAPLWVKVNIVSTPTLEGAISGVVYQDQNQNGVYDSGEMLVGSREVQLFLGTACHVTSPAIMRDTTNGNGRYLFHGRFSGDYCVGLVGDDGLDDVIGVALTSGQTVDNINLQAPLPNGSISGFLWNDSCLTAENGDRLEGNCVLDGNGNYHADGMIQPTESFIAGVTILLQAGSCANNNNVKVAAVTDNFGKYLFSDLQPGTYCVSMNAAAGDNAAKLLPGDWTFPAKGIWYHQISLQQGTHANPVNFGWDYQFK